MVKGTVSFCVGLLLGSVAVKPLTHVFYAVLVVAAFFVGKHFA